MSRSLKDKCLGAPGYAADLHLSHDELKYFRELVSRRYFNRMISAGMKHYGCHEYLFPKSERLLHDRDVQAIKKCKFMARLRKAVGDFTLSNIVLPDGTIEQREEIYYRIVRPNQATDVGKLHRDRDFHEKYGIQKGQDSIKCWIPLWCEPDCGLKIDGQIFSEAGTIVMFGQDTPHQGMVNTGRTARVSVEITLIL